MRRLRSNGWNQFNAKMSQKIGKIMNERTVEGIDLEKEYQLILEKKSKLSANMREAVEYHYLHKHLKKKEEVVEAEVVK